MVRNSERDYRDFFKWIRTLPCDLGRKGAGFFILGLLAFLGGAVVVAISTELNRVAYGLSIVAFGLALISVSIGLISIGAAYKSSKQTNSIEERGSEMERHSKMKWVIWLEVACIVFIMLGVACFITGLCKSDYSWLSAGWGCGSVGVGLVALKLGVESRKQMRAMSNMEVREKMAMMYAYLGKQKERVECDRKAALELADWVDEELKQDFDKVWEEYQRLIESDSRVSESIETRLTRIEDKLDRIVNANRTSEVEKNEKADRS